MKQIKEKDIETECEKAKGNCAECGANDVCESYNAIYDIEEW